MRLTTSLAAPALAIAAALAFAACSDSTSSSTCGSGTPPNLVGTYKLASYTLGTITVDTTAGASGQLRFYAADYAFDLTIPVQGTISDSGTYTLSGVRCVSETSVAGKGATNGTFTLTSATPGAIFSFTGTNTAVGGLGFVAVRQ